VLPHLQRLLFQEYGCFLLPPFLESTSNYIFKTTDCTSLSSAMIYSRMPLYFTRSVFENNKGTLANSVYSAPRMRVFFLSCVLCLVSDFNYLCISAVYLLECFVTNNNANNVFEFVSTSSIVQIQQSTIVEVDGCVAQGNHLNDFVSFRD